MVRARLERHVHRCAARPLAGLLERDDLGVRSACALVPALTDDLAVPFDDGADDGVRMRGAAAPLGEVEGALEQAHDASETSSR